MYDSCYVNDARTKQSLASNSLRRPADSLLMLVRFHLSAWLSRLWALMCLVGAVVGDRS